MSLQYAPMMFDAIHFTYYWVPCAYTFPEMARLVAQLGFQQAVGRPVEVCPPGMAPPVEPAAAAAELGLPGGSHVSLAQDAEQTAAAYSAALKLSGKAELLGKGKGALSSHAMGKAASTSAPNAAAAAAGTASAASVEVLAGDGAAKTPGGGMHAAMEGRPRIWRQARRSARGGDCEDHLDLRSTIVRQSMMISDHADHIRHPGQAAARCGECNGRYAVCAYLSPRKRDHDTRARIKSLEAFGPCAPGPPPAPALWRSRTRRGLHRVCICTL